ncbi:hypothetical protein NL676_000280 [Syzygium grande]|nr:hypothetical protein NL676_000280 [Syzygium grande]
MKDDEKRIDSMRDSEIRLQEPGLDIKEVQDGVQGELRAEAWPALPARDSAGCVLHQEPPRLASGLPASRAG